MTPYSETMHFFWVTLYYIGSRTCFIISTIGLAGEEVVLSQARDRGHGSRVRMNLSGLLDREGSLTSATGEVQEKRTRFSLSHDDGSIGNKDYRSVITSLSKYTGVDRFFS